MRDDSGIWHCPEESKCAKKKLSKVSSESKICKTSIAKCTDLLHVLGKSNCLYETMKSKAKVIIADQRKGVPIITALRWESPLQILIIILVYCTVSPHHIEVL